MGSELLSHFFGKCWDAPAEWLTKRPKIEAYNSGRYCTVVTKKDDPPRKRVYMYSPYFPPLNRKFKNQSTQKYEEAVVLGMAVPFREYMNMGTPIFGNTHIFERTPSPCFVHHLPACACCFLCACV